MNLTMEGPWECTVIPDKEFLQQTHLICVVPPYKRVDLLETETIAVRLYAVSSGKTSEPHTFLYTAASTAPTPSMAKIENASNMTTADGEVILSNKLSSGPPPIIVPGSITTNGKLSFLIIRTQVLVVLLTNDYSFLIKVCIRKRLQYRRTSWVR